MPSTFIPEQPSFTIPKNPGFGNINGLSTETQATPTTIFESPVTNTEIASSQNGTKVYSENLALKLSKLRGETNPKSSISNSAVPKPIGNTIPTNNTSFSIPNSTNTSLPSNHTLFTPPVQPIAKSNQVMQVSPFASIGNLDITLPQNLATPSQPPSTNNSFLPSFKIEEQTIQPSLRDRIEPPKTSNIEKPANPNTPPSIGTPGNMSRQHGPLPSTPYPQNSTPKQLLTVPNTAPSTAVNQVQAVPLSEDTIPSNILRTKGGAVEGADQLQEILGQYL